MKKLFILLFASVLLLAACGSVKETEQVRK